MSGTAAERTGAEAEAGRDDLLRVLARLASEVGEQEIADEAARLAERLAGGRFYVACVGQFKRGKSTLINALCGAALLPTGVVPVTSVITVVRHGERITARVKAAGAPWRDVPPDDLPEYVSEEGNPRNAKGIHAVEVFAPSPLLASGMCLIDTPGLGSVFETASSTARAFVPHIDAALLLLGADPPISGEELDLAASLTGHVRDLIVIINKCDRMSDGERAEALAFTRDVLERRLGRAVGRIFEISAARRMHLGEASYDWPNLERTLEALARSAGTDLVRAAGDRGLDLLSRGLLRSIDRQIAACTTPIAETEIRVESLRRCAAEAARSLHELTYLLQAEQDRIGGLLEAQSKEFLDRAIPSALEALDAGLASAPHRTGPPPRSHLLKEAREVSQRLVDPWLREQEGLGEELCRRAHGRFIAMAGEFLQRATGDGDARAEIGAPVVIDAGFRTPRRFYHGELFPLLPDSPWKRGLDRLRPRAAALRSIRRDVSAYLILLLKSNVRRVLDDITERIVESRRFVESEVCARLSGAVASAERALERARARHAAGATAVGEELRRLGALRDRIESLRLCAGDAGGRA
jgi:GTP-binding protein EngB required for normal cell division